MPTSFIRSTIDVRQFSFCPLSAAIFCSTASTSTAGCAGACAGFGGAAVGAVPAAGGRFAGGGLDGAAGRACALLPKIASLILSKMLMEPPLGHLRDE